MRTNLLPDVCRTGSPDVAGGSAGSRMLAGGGGGWAKKRVLRTRAPLSGLVGNGDVWACREVVVVEVVVVVVVVHEPPQLDSAVDKAQKRPEVQ